MALTEYENLFIQQEDINMKKKSYSSHEIMKILVKRQFVFTTEMYFENLRKCSEQNLLLRCKL